MLCAVYIAKCSSDIGKAHSADGWGESNPLPPGTRNANYHVPWAKSLLDTQPPFLLGQKCLLENIMERSPCKFLEDIFTVKIKKKKKRKKSLLSPNVSWKSNRPCWQPNADHTKDSCWVELDFGRRSGKRLQLLSSKRFILNRFSGEAAKDISVSSWHSHLRPRKDVVGGLPDEHLALIICSFIELTVKHRSKGARKRSEETACPTCGNHSMKPETFHHESNPESSGPSRAVQIGKAPLVLIQSPWWQLPQFQQRHDRKPRDEKDKRTMLALAPTETWLSLPSSCLYWALICPCATPQHGSECERWPGWNSNSAVGLLLPDLAGSREQGNSERCWLASLLAGRFPPKKSLKMAVGQRRSSVPDPRTYLGVCGGEPTGLVGGNQSLKGLLCLFLFLAKVFGPKPCRS